MKTRVLVLMVAAIACLGSQRLLAEPTAADQAFDGVMTKVLTIHASLTSDRYDDASRKEAAALNAAALSLQGTSLLPGSVGLVQTMVDRSAELTKASLPGVRTTFIGLSEAIDTYLKSFYKGDHKYYRFFCDMLKKPWAQSTDKPVANPFYDASMRSCGRLVP